MRQLYNAPTHTRTPWNLQLCVFCISLHYLWQRDSAWSQDKWRDSVISSPSTSRCCLVVRSKQTLRILSFMKKILSLAMFRPIYCSWQKASRKCSLLHNTELLHREHVDPGQLCFTAAHWVLHTINNGWNIINVLLTISQLSSTFQLPKVS